MASTDPTGPGLVSPEPEVVTPGADTGPDPVQVEADLATRVIREPSAVTAPGPPAPVADRTPACTAAFEEDLLDQPYRLAPHGPEPDRHDGHVQPFTGLVVVYDETCELCRRARAWLAGQTTFVPLELLAAGSAEAHQRYGSLPWLGEELVVVDQDGQAWIGPAAFLMAMWATHRYRHWSYRLSGPAFAPLAEQFFHRISNKRRRIGALLVTGARSTGFPAPTHRRDPPPCTHCARPGVPS